MMSSRSITLFAEPAVTNKAPSPFLISILLHCLVLGLVWLGLKHTLRTNNEFLAQRYTVRILNIRKAEPKMRWFAKGGVAQPAPQVVARAAASGGQPAAPSAPRQIVQMFPAAQTLVQPDLPPNLLLPQEIPVPLVLMWSPENVPAKKLVPPPPREATAANVRPSLAPPNRESKLADLKISPSVFATAAPSLPSSTSSPLTVRGPETAKQQVPETASQSLGPPTPARVMSLSDLRLPEGTIALPLANETSSAQSSGTSVTGRKESTAGAGNGNVATEQNGVSGVQGSGEPGDRAAGANGPLGQSGTKPNTSDGSDTGSGADKELTVRVMLPKDGQFGVVVVGSSMTEEYPETLGVWTGRLAYTVYLHVGLAKNWILQYSLPRAAEASVAGNVTRPDAPWPYLIVRPQLAPGDSNTDAILVHGFVNATGHFERLAVISPAQFAQTKFLLTSLEQWQFRPAMQQGQMTAVEVLLIIPEEQG